MSKKNVAMLVSGLGLTLSACTAQYTGQLVNHTLQQSHLKDNYQIQRDAQWVLPPATAIYIAWPQTLDASTIGIPNPPARRKAIALQKALLNGFTPVYPLTRIGDASSSLAVAFSEAAATGNEILISPMLSRYIDKRNTRQELAEGRILSSNAKQTSRVRGVDGSQEGKPLGLDSVHIQLRVYEVRTQRLLDVAHITAYQNFFAAPESTPSDLFADSIRHYVNQLSPYKTL